MFVGLRLQRLLHVNEQSFRIRVKRGRQPIKAPSSPPELLCVCVLQPQTDFVLQKFLLNCDILKSGPAPGPFWLQNLVSSSARAPCFQNKSVCFLFLREEISASSPAVMQPESNGGGAAPHLCCGGGRAATADRGDAQRARASWRRSLAANHAKLQAGQL